jgi:hypothetical protein
MTSKGKLLSEKLKNRDLFEREVKLTSMGKALAMLEECTDQLILTMRTIEKMGLIERENIQEYVLNRMEAYEKKYYLMEDDIFDEFIREFIKR